MRRHAKALIATSAMLLSLAFAQAAAAGPPTLTVDPVTSHSITTAHLTGSITVDSEANGGSETYYFFQYTEAGKGEWAWGPQAFSRTVPAGSGPTAVDEDITNLKASTAYEARLVAFPTSDFSEVVSDPSAPFTTDPAPNAPTVTVSPATEVAYTRAHLAGTIDPEGGNVDPVAGPIPIQWRFEANREGEGWSEVASGEISGTEAEGSDPIEVQGDATGLQPGSKYAFRLRAVYAGTDAFSTEEEFETEAVAKPTVTDPLVSEVDGDSAHLEATVDTNAPKDNSELSDNAKEAFATNWHFEYSTDGGANWSTEEGGGGTVPADDEPLTVEANPTLEPRRTYLFRLVASNAAGSVESAAVQFTTDAVPAGFADSPVWDPTQTTATLTARVNPHNVDVTGCHFAYGIGAPAGNQVPCPNIPQGNGFHFMTAKVGGLTPGSMYHFKLVLTTAEGTMESPEQTFPTGSETASETCANEAIRAEQDARAPECRAYEKVTPHDKNGGDAPAGNDLTVVASVDGNGVTYASRTGFADTVGTGAIGFTQYLARRGAEGWSTHSITPTPSPHSMQIFFGGMRLMLFSEDLSRALVHSYDLPSVSDDIASDVNLYSMDTGSRSLQTITKPLTPDSKYAAFIVSPAAGTSADATHVAFSGRGEPETRLLEEAAPGVENTYEWDNGVLRLAGVLPDGKAPEGGSTMRTPCGIARCSYRATVSTDGTRIAFLSPAEGEKQLYLRRNHTDSVWVSEPETSDPVGNLQAVDLEWVSPSGKRLLFTTGSGLVDEDTNESSDLYLYTDGPDPTQEPENLTMMPAAGSQTTVIGANEEATRVFTHDLSGNNIFLLNEGEIKLVSGGVLADPLDELAAVASEPGRARVSADGTRLAFLSTSRFGVGLTGQVDGVGEVGTQQMYLYDAVADTLTCASCLNGGAVNDSASVTPLVGHTTPTQESPGSRPRFLSSDGRRLFFSTASALVPEDTNGVNDAYLYDAERGQASLLSPGDTADSVWFQEASASGEDVFLVTRAQLVGADTDRLVDLYDARVEGGFPEPPPPPAPCAGEGCMGPIVAAPAQTSPATPNFVGPGNRRCKKKGPRCRRNKKAQRKKAQRRKAQRKKAGHEKRAQNTKRGGRR